MMTFIDPRLMSMAGPPRWAMSLLGGDGPAPMQPVSPGPMIDPNAGPMPVMQAPASPVIAQRPDLFHRIVGGLLPAPQALGGLLSPDDTHTARRQALLDIGMSLLANSAPQAGRNAPPTLAAIGQALQAGREGFQQHLASILQQKQLATQQQQQQRLDAVRQQYAASPLPASATPEQRIAHLVDMSEAYANAGDPDTAGKLAQLAGAIKQTNGQPNRLQVVQTGDAVYTFDPATGTYTKGPERHKTADEIALRQQDQQLRAEQIRAMRDAREQNMAKSLTQGFNSRTKPLQERGAIIDQAIKTIDDAAHNPDPNVRKVLYSSAVANFVQAADQKAQLRFQLLDYFKKNVDPSIGGKWNLLRERMLNGSLPQYAMEGMLHHLQGLKQLTRGEFEQQRAGEVKRHPVLDGWLPESDEFFGGGAAAPGPSAQGKPALDDIFGGNP